MCIRDRLGLGPVGLGRVGPLDDLTARVGLAGGEGQLVRVLGQRADGDLELLELPRLDLPARPGDLQYGLGDLVAVVGDHGLGQLSLGQLHVPAGNRPDRDEGKRVIGGELDFQLGRLGLVPLVRNAEGDLGPGALLGGAGVDRDVGERGQGQAEGEGERTGGDGDGATADGGQCHGGFSDRRSRVRTPGFSHGG